MGFPLILEGTDVPFLNAHVFPSVLKSLVCSGSAPRPPPWLHFLGFLLSGCVSRGQLLDALQVEESTVDDGSPSVSSPRFSVPTFTRLPGLSRRNQRREVG